MITCNLQVFKIEVRCPIMASQPQFPSTNNNTPRVQKLIRITMKYYNKIK